MQHAISVEDGELLYMIIRSEKIGDEFHKIISKKGTDGRIYASSILETDESKSVRNFDACTKEEFIYKCNVEIDEMFTSEARYDWLNLSSINDLDEQLRYLKERPDDFSRWDTSGEHPRKTRIDNSFLLDN